ncbi:MAG: thiamine pyrophosphate-dependent enzyme [Pseudomonadota bacterium]
MSDLLNKQRPPMFCPGCGHEQAVMALEKAFLRLGWPGHEIVIVSDIGCSGLFDTFFNTHAFHGLHGRAVTYGVGIKMARPDLHVVVTMGDGGFGIGAAHILSACRRNIDITLIVLNNFNFGMTGGQCSPTTPADMNTGSGFLNRLEKPIDISRLVAGAGAAYAVRTSAYQKDLPEILAAAMQFEGFSVVDLQGICSGRVARRNVLTPGMLEASLDKPEPSTGAIPANIRHEYGKQYRETAARQPRAPAPIHIRKRFRPLIEGREEILILGGAGQRIVTAGEILCLAGMTAGLKVTCKTDYPVTVLRGHSVSEVVLSSETIGFTGIEIPGIVIALSQEGVERRRSLLENLPVEPFAILAAGVSLPFSKTKSVEVDFRAMGIKSRDWALASLGVMVAHKMCITEKMLGSALSIRFEGDMLAAARDLIKKGIGSR